MRYFYPPLKHRIPPRFLGSRNCEGDEALPNFHAENGNCDEDTMKSFLLVVMLAMLLTFVGCGGMSSMAPPPPATFTIGGTVTGLTATGLVLQDNGGDNLSVPASATSFTFATKVASGAAYSVGVFASPAGQACSVTSGGTGNATANVTSVVITCVAGTGGGPFTISAAVTGLTGSLVLQDNLADNLTFTSNITQAFAIQIASGSNYSVTILTQPAGQTCTLGSNASGPANGPVTVAVSCSTIVGPVFTITAAVSGLTSGSGSLVLTDNGGDNLTFPSSATAPFATQVSIYDVEILTQPTGASCSFPGTHSGTATANTTVSVTCVPTTVNLTISAAVSGLSGGTLVLTDNGGDNLSFTTNTTQPFAIQIASGAAYDVEVLTQPASQTCSFSGSHSGTATTNVTVNVTCTATVVNNEWIWQSGSNAVGQLGNYGTKGTASSTNIPGSRYAAVTWIDSSENLWFFGGFGNGTVLGTENFLNDLWKFTLSTGQWTWISGSNSIDQNGNYGTVGVSAPSNIPGARSYATSWKDTAGNFWFFGGFGFDSNSATGTAGPLNDLWEFKSGQWIWQGGANLVNGAAQYGTQGSGSTTNIPGARRWAAASTDASGNFYLFGGVGLDNNGADGSLNDLWKFTPSTGVWTWISGSNTVNGQPNYGTQGVAGANNVPGARNGAVSWIDSGGNVWLFGGNGIDDAGNVGYLNDLWMFNVATTDWTWVAGDKLIDQPGVYGTLGAGDPSNTPGGRTWPANWTDAAGNFWLLGGEQVRGNDLNDLWEWSGGQWTWMSGANGANNQIGIYGTLGVAAPSNVPGSRRQPSSWADSSGNLWMMGGFGWDATGIQPPDPDSLNDLWEFTP
jgi:hypothetical protein